MPRENVVAVAVAFLICGAVCARAEKKELSFSYAFDYFFPSEDSHEKVVPIPANPCIDSCSEDPSSFECMHCCRTVKHEVDWRCQDDASAFFKRSSADCCSGNWDASCWDTPMPQNFYHACASCCGECSNAFSGCDDCRETDGNCNCGGCTCADGTVPSNLTCTDGSNFECRGISDGICFPSDALVNVKGVNRMVRMDQLKKGDQVLVQGGNYETVYAFGGHQDPNAKAEMFKLTTEHTALSLSGNHWLPIGGDFKRAKDVQIGDVLVVYGKEGERMEAVVRIDLEEKRGLFNPLTASGSIVVNSVAASCYASKASPAYMHALLTPIRLAAKAFPILTIEFVDRLGNDGKTIPALVQLGDRLLAALEAIVKSGNFKIASASFVSFFVYAAMKR